VHTIGTIYIMVFNRSIPIAIYYIHRYFELIIMIDEKTTPFCANHIVVTILYLYYTIQRYNPEPGFTRGGGGGKKKKKL